MYDPNYYGNNAKEEAKTSFEDNNIFSAVNEGNQRVPQMNKDSGLAFNGNGAPVTLKVVKPQSYDDGPDIVDSLIAGSTVVLNIESLDRDKAKRLIDFLLGALHVLQGDLKRVSATTLVLAPSNTNVSGFDSENDETEDFRTINDENYQ
jgi:FtsZ-interacting cell division protein YlmF